MRGAVRQRALGPVFQQGELVVAHAPAAGKVLPVLDGTVVGVQLEAQGVQQVLVVHQVADLRHWRLVAALLTHPAQVPQLLGKVWGEGCKVS